MYTLCMCIYIYIYTNKHIGKEKLCIYIYNMIINIYFVSRWRAA